MLHSVLYAYGECQYAHSVIRDHYMMDEEWNMYHFIHGACLSKWGQNADIITFSQSLSFEVQILPQIHF